MNKDEQGRPLTYWGGSVGTKQETLEEVATKEGLYRCSQNNFNQAQAGYNAKWFKRGVLFGVELEQERSYSEEYIAEKLFNHPLMERIRSSKSDAEARRIVLQQLKKK